MCHVSLQSQRVDWFFSSQHFPFHLSVYQHFAVSRLQSVTAKIGAGLSHKHSAVVNWINTARLTFPVAEYLVHVTVFLSLSHGATFAGSPFV